MVPPAVVTESLGRRFHGVPAVDDLSLEIPAGSVFGFLGPNGSGKTTTIRLLLGLLRPDAGRARVLGFDTRTDAARIRERSGALLEHTGLYERLTAEQNLDFFGRVWRMPAAERARRAQELLERFDLWHRRHERVGGWSRGMRQRLAIARTLLHRPDLIFLDEPSNGLDAAAAADLRAMFRAQAEREGRTVFLTTHNLAEAEQFCTLVGIVRRGRLIAFGPPDELRVRSGKPRLEIRGRGITEPILSGLRNLPGVGEARLDDGRLLVRLDNGADPSAVVRRLVADGVAVEEVRQGAATLEEAFLRLVRGEQTEP
jgi:ABC-2 type transport system ATP-binding protein